MNTKKREWVNSPSETTTVVSRIMMPMDANISGNVFGGSIMKLVDEVAAMAAHKHSRMNVVTASIGRMDFHSPVHVGDFIKLIATVNYVHKSSMEVGVRVEVEEPKTGKTRHTGTCYLTFVGLNKRNAVARLPRLNPRTADEIRRWDEALARRLQMLAQKTMERRRSHNR